MPVNKCEWQVDNKGTYVPCGEAYSNVDKFAIVGFTTLALGDEQNPTMPAVLRGNDTRAIGTQGSTGSCPNNATLGTASGGAYGLGGWNLDTLATSQCGAPSPPDTISNLQITSKQGNNVTTYTGCTTSNLTSACDYVYDLTARTIDWYKDATRAGASGYNVDFDWDIAGSPGYCGIRSSDSSALCIITTWKGFASLDGEVGIGNDFGTRGFVLCDFDYNSCPAGVKP
jgi:hypothetical protein